MGQKMKISDKILNISNKKQKLLEGLIIFLILLGVSFEYSNGKTTWIFQKYPFVIFLSTLFSLILIFVWIKVEKKLVQKKINEILHKSNKTDNVNELTTRQKQVYDLILLNKSNKEICSELFIELSTLKTHINKIYKILNVKNRKGLKSRNID